MPTILVFIPFSRHIFRHMLAGVHRFYAGAAKVQIVEGCANAARLKHLLELWRPKGCIVEASEGIGIFTRRNLGGVPTVYLDRASLKTPEFDVVQDYVAGSEAAARELISPAMAHYAFVGYHIATTWSHERCKAFRAAAISRCDSSPTCEAWRARAGWRRSRARARRCRSSRPAGRTASSAPCPRPSRTSRARG